MIRIIILTTALALVACGDNITPDGTVDACGGAVVDAANPIDAPVDAGIDAVDCRLPPCDQATTTRGAWDTWAAACFEPGECRLVYCPAMGDNLVHVCRGL